MKSKHRTPRPYRQTARAAAAEETHRRILDSMLKHIREKWFEEVTLDAVAADAGVTVQTVLRRFGTREQLLAEAADHLGKEAFKRRTVARGDLIGYVNALTADYETSGDFVCRLLAQEDRYPALRAFLDFGRRGHREWMGETFAPWLTGLDAKTASARLDAMVAAADVYLWRLVRRDMKRPVAAYKKLALTLLGGVLRDDWQAPAIEHSPGIEAQA
jgi:AcrR family transcriptional regulator